MYIDGGFCLSHAAELTAPGQALGLTDKPVLNIT